MCCEPRYAQELDAFFGGAANAPAWDTLRAHVASCQPCRAAYNGRAWAERFLAGGTQGWMQPSERELSAIERVVLEASAPVEASRTARWLAELRAWLTPARLVPIAVAAIAIAVVVPLSMTARDATAPGERGPAPVVNDEGFQVRGHAGAARRVGLRAFCINGDVVRPLDAATNSPPECSRTGQLRLTAGNGGGFRFLFAIGVDESRTIQWYTPRPPAQQSEPAPPVASADAVSAFTPVGRPVRLAVNHVTGALRIFALFSDKPILRRDVVAAVEGLPPGPLPALLPTQRLGLPAAEVQQMSILLRITP